MGFHQLAVRCLSCLVLNHLQLLIVALVKKSFEPKSKKHIKEEVSNRRKSSLLLVDLSLLWQHILHYFKCKLWFRPSG